MLYVVEHGQSAHFSNLFQILKIVSKNADKNCSLKHVQFGRIKGMSTRKGTAVFLSDILDEAKDRMAENMRKSDTTKVTDENDFEQVAETLGISAVIRRTILQNQVSRFLKINYLDSLTLHIVSSLVFTFLGER